MFLRFEKTFSPDASNEQHVKREVYTLADGVP